MTNEKAIMCLEDMKIKVPIPKAAKQARENNEALDVAIKALQPAEPKRGKWERHYSRLNVYADLFWHCSECGYKDIENYAPVYHHFCPNCGAKMEVTE